MVQALIILVLGLTIWGSIWALAGVLEKRVSRQKQAAGHPNNQDDMDDYED